jgi:hypothetical protein
MNASAPSPRQSQISVIVIGIIASLIASILFSLGVLLASIKVPEYTVVQFSLSEKKVGHLATWYVRLINTSPYAFDVEFFLPSQKMLHAEFQPPSSNPDGWKAQLIRGGFLEALFVIDSPDAPFSEVFTNRS